MHHDPNPQLSSLLREVIPHQPGVRDIVAACWRGRRVIATLAVIGAVAGAGIGRFIPARYEAAATFRVAERAGRTIAFRTFQTVLQSNGLAQDVIRQHKLDEPPLSLTPAAFKRDYLTIEEVRDTNVLRAHVMMPEPKLAADVANSLAARAVGTYEAMIGRDPDVTPSETVTALKSQVDAAVATRDAAERRLVSFRSQAQIDILRRDANDALDTRRRLTELDLTIDGERGRLASAEAELAKQPRTVSVPRQLGVSDALLLLSGRTGTGTNPGLTSDVARNDVINPVRTQLELEAVTLRGSVAALDQQVQQLSRTVKPSRQDASHLAEVQLALQAERGRLGSIETELAKQPNTISIPRSVGASEALLLSLAGANKAEGDADGIAKELTHTEMVNPVYAQLEGQVATLRTGLAALEAQRRGMAGLLGADAPSRRLTQVYERENEMARLQRDLNEAERVVTSTTTKYDQARAAAPGDVAHPEIIDPAALPDQSLSRGMIALGVAGLLIGLLTATTFVLARELLVPSLRSIGVELT